ncbi:MAG: ABC transporter ATP-binding protein [Lachnospiraceae bacterium]|nr:ABC transporter ATP-binding protein [Lachnospiraceae bacterium]
MSEYIVEMKHITKRFPGIVANDDVSLQIKKGEIFAILGENGAGKSTLMSMLFGMYEPDEGEIFVRGEKVALKSPNHAAALNIGMVHQHFKLISNYTVAENIVLGREPMRKFFGAFSIYHKRKANSEVRSLSEKYGLAVNPTDIVSRMNVSARQRVEILKMLYRDAEILIFDEPTAVLTPQEILFLLDIINGMRENGKTIILITHKLEEIKKIADRCGIMNHGKLIAVLDVAETDTKTMANLMIGREVAFHVRKKRAGETGKTVLQLEHVNIFNEQRVQVVKDVSLEVHEGEILAVAGVAGNGQVELADAVAGLTPVSSGRILLQGKDITGLSVRRRALEGISYIPEDRQHYGLILDFTLAENLGLRGFFKEPFCKSGILDQKVFRENSRKLIEKYDIRCGRGCDTVVRSMSGGNQQKAIIAREIEQDAQLLIFVQPTRGLDIGAIENIHKQMVKERDRGKAILLVSLELDEIMNCADTIAVIYNGSIQKTAPAETLTTNQVGEFMMGVKETDGEA